MSLLPGQELQEIVERLFHAPADGELLDRAPSGAVMLLPLHETHDRPFDRAERLPEAHMGGIDGNSGGALISREEIGPRADAADRVLAAEAPGLDAQPAQILQRVAQCGNFPIDD